LGTIPEGADGSTQEAEPEPQGNPAAAATAAAAAAAAEEEEREEDAEEEEEERQEMRRFAEEMKRFRKEVEVTGLRPAKEGGGAREEPRARGYYQPAVCVDVC
jgi:hypothetical protein